MNPRSADAQTLLEHAWAGARRGQPTLVVLRGEAGIGKSWTLARFRAARPAAELLLGARRPAWPAELLEQGHGWWRELRDPGVLAAARQLAPHLAWPALAGAATPPDSGEAALRALFGGALRLAGTAGGLGVVLEDAHDYAPAQLDAAAQLWRRALGAGAPLLLVLSTRPDAGLDDAWLEARRREAAGARPGQGGFAVELAELGALDEAGTAALCRELLPGAAVPGELAPWVQARSGGHPLHAAQLLRHLQDADALRAAGPVWVFDPHAAPAAPRGLSRLLQANLGALRADPDAWALTGALAVLDAGATPAQLGEVLAWPPEQVREELGAGEARGHLARGSGGRCSLAHPLMPGVVRGLLGGPERRSLHARAAAASPDPDERARQARLGAHPAARAWTGAALQAALNRHDWPQVEVHARALLPAAGDAGAPLRLALARALHAQGRAREAEPLLQGLQVPGAPALHAAVLRALARPAEALRVLEGGVLEGNGDGDGQENGADAALLRAGLQIETGARDEARGTLGALLARPLSPARRALALGELGRLAYMDADFARACALNVEAAAGLSEEHDAELLSLCLSRVGMLCTQLGRWAEAEAALLRSTALQAELGHFAAASARHNNLGLLYAQQGRYGEARTALERALRLADASGERATEADALHNLSNTLYALGEAGASLRALERCVALRGEAGLSALAAGTALYLADREARLGRPERGLRLLAAGDGLPIDAYLAATRILLCAGRPQEAQAWLRRGGTSNAAGQADAALAWALCALRLAPPEVAGHVQTALAQAGGHPYRAAEARLLLALAGAPGTPERAGGAAALRTLAEAPGHLWLYERVVPAELAALRAEAGAPGRPDADAPPATLRALGDFALCSGGVVRPWRARKVRELLALLLCAALSERGPGVGRAALCAALWPDAPDGAADASLRVAARRLRAALGDAAAVRVEGARYVLDLRHADVLAFVQALDHGDLALACATYGGDFLPGLDLEPVPALREVLRGRWRAAALDLAPRSPLAEAEALYAQLLAADPLDLPAHRALLGDLAARGEHGRARAALSRAEALFQAELGEVPDELRRAPTARAR